MRYRTWTPRFSWTGGHFPFNPCQADDFPVAMWETCENSGQFGSAQRGHLMTPSIGPAGIFALVLSIAATASLAQSREPTARESKLVRDCAAEHVDDGKGEEQCAFRLVADPCIEKEGNSNQGTANCYRMEAAIWDRLLNDNYKELMAAIDDKQDQDKLKEMQRAWIAYRDTTCNFYWYKI